MRDPATSLIDPLASPGSSVSEVKGSTVLGILSSSTSSEWCSASGLSSVSDPVNSPVGKPADCRYCWHMKNTSFQTSLIVLLLVVVSPVLAADITPPSQPQPPAPQQNNPSTGKPPSDTAPGTRDQGMVKEPQTVPHPDSVVTPPVIDPKMAVDPEAKTKEERHPALTPEQTPRQNK